mmetsp:Transcript_107773/g.313697  ORF Transcript_107773/g.313697 Transcript_107773/m.313697 type:complete len:211 (+) Transcript_107773:237-869(+)
MKVASAIGTHFNQMPASRDYTLRFVNVGPAAKVTLTTAGKTMELRAARHGHAHSKATKTSDSGATWSYDGPTTTLVVTLPAVVTAEGFTLDVGLACPSAGCGAADALLSGLRGAMSYTKKAKATLDEARLCPGESDTETGATQTLAATGSALSHEAIADANAFWTRVAGVPSLLSDAQAELEDMAVDDDASKWRQTRALALLGAAATGLA